MSERKFQHPALDDLYQALEDIETAEGLLKEAKQRLTETVQALPSRIGDNEDLRDAVVHHFYWFDDRVPVTALKQAFQVKAAAHARKNEIAKILRSAEIEMLCIRCQQPYLLEVTSRDNLKRKLADIERDKANPDSYGAGWARTCPSCLKARDAQYKQAYEQERQEQRLRYQELHTMPYYDYLQTPEWQARRKRAMKRAGFRCQVCNAYGVRLNVHHRTYERRGFEDDRDLLVLCEGCHQIFHENGSLAEAGQ